MAALHHAPNIKGADEHPEIASRNSRYGLALFAVYLALYAGFMLLNAFLPQLMEHTPVAGVNLAILYGFGLIVAALLLALVYGWLCRGRAIDEGDKEAQR